MNDGDNDVDVDDVCPDIVPALMTADQKRFHLCIATSNPTMKFLKNKHLFLEAHCNSGYRQTKTKRRSPASQNTPPTSPTKREALVKGKTPVKGNVPVKRKTPAKSTASAKKRKVPAKSGAPKKGKAATRTNTHDTSNADTKETETSQTSTRPTRLRSNSEEYVKFFECIELRDSPLHRKGIFAKKKLTVGMVLEDPNVSFIRAFVPKHLNQTFNYIQYGDGYFSVRDDTADKFTLTFFLNEARSPDQPNIKWKVIRDSQHLQPKLQWQVTREIEVGVELLVMYQTHLS